MARGGTGVWSWVAWASLSAACYACIAWIVYKSNSALWSFTSVMSPDWMYPVRMVVAPAVGAAALILSLATLGLLVFRRFHPALLAGSAACLVLLLAYIGLETYFRP